MDLKNIILVVVCMITSVSTFASEKLFWQTIEKFDTNWLKSERDAKQLLNLAEKHYSNSEKNSLMLSSLIYKKFDFLKFYGTPIESKDHLESHIDNVSASDNFYNTYTYLSELAILYFELGLLERYEQVKEKLLQSNANSFFAAVKLATQPSEANYELLYSFCEDGCSFPLYYIAIANYYAVSGQYSLLEVHSNKVISQHYNLEDIRSKLFIAYVYVAIKCQKINDEVLDDISSAVVDDIKHLKGFHNRLVSILNTECKR
jgi:hypothetical protein